MGYHLYPKVVFKGTDVKKTLMYLLLLKARLCVSLVIHALVLCGLWLNYRAKKPLQMETVTVSAKR